MQALIKRIFEKRLNNLTIEQLNIFEPYKRWETVVKFLCVY